MTKINKFNKFSKLNEDVFIDDDGWNTDELREVGLIDLLDRVERMKYEIETSVRNSGGVNGDTSDDLINDIRDVGEQFLTISEDMLNW